MSILSSEASHHNDRAYWSAVFAMTLCVFTLIASEFMPVSLLTPISEELGVSEGLVGQGIAISGAFAVLASLSISTLAGAINRKVLLLGMTALMAISSAIIALASSYVIYMAGRALVGIAIGGFWSLSAATAIRLVPPHFVSRALAIFNGGNALATVIAAPLGSYLGSIIGWRGAFFCLVPVAVIAFVWQWFSLPALTVDKRDKQTGTVFHLLTNPLVVVGLAACGMLFMGQFSLFTYLRPFLEAVTQVDITQLSLILLTIGIAGLVGTLVIGAFLKSGFYPTLITIPLLMALIAGALIMFGHHIGIVAPLLGLWGLIATAAPTGWWIWVAKTLPNDAEAGGGLMVAVVQLSIALGSTIGGFAFDHSGYQSTFTISGILLAAAAALALFTSRKDSYKTH